MYNISSKCRDALHARYRSLCKIRGTITLTSKENIELSSNVLSLNWNNQCCSTNYLNLGAVYYGALTLQIRNPDKTVSIEDKYTNGIVEPYYDVHLGDGSYEPIPLGTFTIVDQEVSSDSITLKTYDNASKLDVKITVNEVKDGTPIDYIKWACKRCKISLGTTESYIKTLPNALRSFKMPEVGKIDTFAYLVGCCCQVMCAFATVDREGKLIIVGLHDRGTPADTLSGHSRFSTNRTGGGTNVQDIIMKVGGTYTSGNNLVLPDTYVADDNIIELNTNPLLESIAELSFSHEVLAELLKSVQKINYIPMAIEYMGNPAYDLGDRVQLKEEEVVTMITYFNFQFHNKCTIKGFPLKSRDKKTVSQSSGSSGGGGGSTPTSSPLVALDWQGNVSEADLRSVLGYEITKTFQLTEDTPVVFEATFKRAIKGTESLVVDLYLDNSFIDTYEIAGQGSTKYIEKNVFSLHHIFKDLDSSVSHFLTLQIRSTVGIASPSTGYSFSYYCSVHGHGLTETISKPDPVKSYNLSLIRTRWGVRHAGRNSILGGFY